MKAKLNTKTISSVTPMTKAYDVYDSDLAGFLLRVEPSGSKFYYCTYRRPDGRKTRVKLGNATVLSPAQARDEARKVLGDRAKGHDPATSRKLSRQDSLGTFIEKHYRPWAESHRKTGAQTVTRALRCFSEFKNQRLSEISQWKVDKWRSSCLQSGNAPATVNRNITMLKAVLSKAVEWDVITANPLAKLKPLRTDSAARIRYLKREEDQDLRKALEAREDRIRDERRNYNQWLAVRHLPAYPNLDETPFVDYLKPMVLLSLNTGMRRGEVFDLRWTDVNLNCNPVLTVEGTTAKSGKTRHIPLNREALETLRRWRSQIMPANDDERVFKSPRGGRFDNVRKSWRALLKLSGIEGFRWHDMRHDFASKLVMNGVDLYRVCELLGHSDMKITRRYAHLAPQAMADAVATLDNTRKQATVVSIKTEQLVERTLMPPETIRQLQIPVDSQKAFHLSSDLIKERGVAALSIAEARTGVEATKQTPHDIEGNSPAHGANLIASL